MITLFQNIFMLRRPRVAIFVDIIKIMTMFEKTIFKIELMYQNATYIYTSWYSKLADFRWKKCLCQLNLRSVSRDSYIFWVLFRSGITVPSFNIVGYVWLILWRGWWSFWTPHPGEVQKMLILNNKEETLCFTIMFLKSYNIFWNFFKLF